MVFEEIKNVIKESNKTALRKFGITIGVFLGLVAAVLYWMDFASAFPVAYIALAFLILGLLIPVLLKPVYILWMSFAVVMGFIMSHVILSLIFFLIFSPVGLVIRLLRKDPLNEKIEPEAKSYWIQRESTAFDPKTVERQY